MNYLSLDLTDNQELLDYLNDKDIGSSCEVKVTATLDSLQKDNASFTVTSVRFKKQEPEESNAPNMPDPLQVIFGDDDGSDEY
jgi:hypothetical protein